MALVYPITDPWTVTSAALLATWGAFTLLYSLR